MASPYLSEMDCWLALLRSEHDLVTSAIGVLVLVQPHRR
jgi:hypothetical protein